MTREEAIEAARQVAQERRWIWSEPVRAVRFRRWLVGPFCWRVTSNTASRGRNVTVTIEDASRRITAAAFSPR